MKRTLITLLAGAALIASTGAPTFATAQRSGIPDIFQSINDRQAELDARIDAGVRDRSLTAAEAAQLRSEFKALAQLEAQYRASGNSLSIGERADLDLRFDALGDRIRSNRNDDERGRGGPPQTIDQRQADLDARIDAGVRDGSLTKAEAAQLQSDFDSIARLEAQYRSSGGVLTANERADLDQRFDALAASIRDNRNDNDGRDGRGGPFQTPSQRQGELDRRIDQAVRDRSLTAAAAAQIRVDFQALVRLENQYRGGPGGLTGAERADLDRRFNQLSARVTDNRNNAGDRRWTNLDQRQAAFNERLDRAVRDGRVGQRDASSLRAEFTQLAGVESQYRRSPPGITPQERTDLNNRFDRLEAAYRNLVNNGRYSDGQRQYDNLFDYMLGLSR